MLVDLSPAILRQEFRTSAKMCIDYLQNW